MIILNTDDNYSFRKAELRKLRGQRDGDDNDDLEDGDDTVHLVLWPGRRPLQRNRAATLVAQVGSMNNVGFEMDHFHEQ